MIHQTVINQVRCDICNSFMPDDKTFCYAFGKDICMECSVKFIQKLESDQFITMEQFQEIADDINYNL